MKTIVVAGALANRPYNAGGAWVRLSWLLGLKKLGFDVYFIEQIDPRSCVDAAGAKAAFQECVNRDYFRQVVSQFGLDGRAALIYGDGEEMHGATIRDLVDVCRSAVALVNISGHLALQSLLEAFRRKVYIDIDPGFTQYWHAEGNLGARLAGHTDFFTIGENIGRQECPIPTGGIPWRIVRQPVVLEDWQVGRNEGHRPFTTIASWRGPFGPINVGGRTLGLKVHEFRKFITLPALTGDEFELALAIEPGDWKDRESLVANGWRLVEPAVVVRGPLEFRDYVTNSAAEFSVAQGVYVDTHSGWFSDRTIRYLAAGLPALVQDTGIGRDSPGHPLAGREGLLVFSTLDEAVSGVLSIRSDYDRHCAAARKLAETHFDSDVVLGKLMDDLGISP
jgi:hypothetical protein